MATKEDSKVVKIKSRSKKEKRKIPVVRILLGIFAVLILAGIIIFNTCKIKTIKIEGLNTYAESDVQKAIKKNGFIDNSIVYYLKCKLIKPDLLPFIRSAEVKIDNPTTITVTIQEKKRVGYFKDKNQYVYFDKKGTMLESSDILYKNIPMITGLSYKKVIMNESLPIKKKSVLDYVVSVMDAIEKYDISIDEVQVQKSGAILLQSGKLTIDLDDVTNVDLKVPELKGILKRLKGQSGTIDFKYFDEYEKRVIFKPKKS